MSRSRPAGLSVASSLTSAEVEAVLYDGSARKRVLAAARAELVFGVLNTTHRWADVRRRSIMRLLSRRLRLPLDLRVQLPDGRQFAPPPYGHQLERGHEIRLHLNDDNINLRWHLYDHGLLDKHPHPDGCSCPECGQQAVGDII